MRKERLASIEKEILRVISTLFLTEIKNPKVKGLVSITRVNVTEDLKFADLYFTILSTEDKEIDNEKVLEGLNEIKGFLRKEVAKTLALRYTPELRVKLDTSIEYAVKISKLLDDLKITKG